MPPGDFPSPPLPFPRAYWVVPGRLLAGQYPGSAYAEEADLKLRALARAGIRLVINLMVSDEVDSYGRPFVPYIERLRQFASENGAKVAWARHPIRDLGVPERDRMRAILDDIDRALAAGQPVYVHCWGGIGRTGTVIGCYLVRHGLASGQGALEEIARLRRHISPYRASPETEEQRAFIRSWQPGE